MIATRRRMLGGILALSVIVVVCRSSVRQPLTPPQG